MLVMTMLMMIMQKLLNFNINQDKWFKELYIYVRIVMCVKNYVLIKVFVLLLFQTKKNFGGKINHKLLIFMLNKHKKN